MQDLPWGIIWFADNRVEVLTEYLLLRVGVLLQQRSSACATWINSGFMINAGMQLASSCRLIFGGPVIALGLTGKSMSAVKWEIMRPTRRPSVSLFSEPWMFLRMHILLISAGWAWRVGMKLRSCRLISAQSSTGTTIREFCKSSVLWILKILCCLYWHNFDQIDHITLWWTVVGVNWLASCQEFRRVVYWTRY